MNPDYFAVYILASSNNRAIYVGQTSDLMKRYFEHKQGLIKGHTKKYNIHKLVYYEFQPDRPSALAREAQLKGWLRVKKNELVEAKNPDWQDIGETLFQHQ